MNSAKLVGNFPSIVPILPLRDMVVFPNVMVPLFLKGSRVVKLAESVAGVDNLVGLFYQKTRSRLGLASEEISLVGTLARIQQVVRLDNGGIKAIADGVCRIRLVRQTQSEPYLMGEVTRLEEVSEPQELLDSFVRSVAALFKVSLTLGRPVSDHSMSMVERADDPGKLADLIAVYLSLKAEIKQNLLEIEDPIARLRKVFSYLHADIQNLQPKLQGLGEPAANSGLMRRQREMGLRHQIRSLQKDLSAPDDPHLSEIKEFEEKVRNSGMPDEAVEVATRELQRLERIPPHSPEYTVSRTYLEVLTSLPWNVTTQDNLDINRAQEILEEDHYNLHDVKDRILEFLAVHKLREHNKGPILCLVGPPGVGKTSLGRSIARALGRKFIRISLGGMRDEAEIRGHRRTYIGAMTGRIIQELRRAGTRNPVFMLDEVDKIGQDFRGDPACALLEVLDPEQNNAFGDHYLDIPFDLSSVMFICTANQLDPIPAPLRDRMEIIRISGYTDEEKQVIAEKFLVRKAKEENGISDYPFTITSDAIGFVIRGFTREAGVRNLEREIGSVFRKLARDVSMELPLREEVTPQVVEELLGPQRFFFDLAEETDQIGIATGLAWTEHGGDIIFIEVTGFRGQKNLTMTGSLGEVMQESARAALSYLRNNCSFYGLDDHLLGETDLHIHVPAGAIPKDGPSAGVTIAVALSSFFTGIPIRRDVAMTGEVTLRGRVLAVGGVKEKLLAARRAGIREVILPKRNEPHLRDLPDYVKEGMILHFVSDVGQAVRIALNTDLPGICDAFSPDQPILPLFPNQAGGYSISARTSGTH
ncbi:endopeptidase La [Desulfomonile tiedjei]|uniref:Lon protease n=1 Tax=Desulfomonile tiedjei (strain ATCC 49306 / DSM 6799 / DCB-1) TaxID=706587 RepID=I4CB52_DESTA|nr:endopeptidase La [Desulfomonile tiedjei]AFM26793.1 ATP-dependent protease La [Desulfomonile tiedjei DSM 6799]